MFVKHMHKLSISAGPIGRGCLWAANSVFLGHWTGRHGRVLDVEAAGCSLASLQRDRMQTILGQVAE